MRDSLGLSLGATKLVAARADGSSTVHPATVTWRDGVLTGFVERFGDPVPIVAPDGSTHSADRLLAHAVNELIGAAGGPREHMSVAVPAHWRDHAVARLRALRPDLTVCSDATTALTALRARPGLPARGLVLLCDFGASGTSITLADAADDFRPVAPTVRYEDFSGELVDRLVLAHLLADVDVDPAATSAVPALAAFREQCRGAKERLSQETATGLAGPVPDTTLRLTRTELDALLADPLDRVLDAIADTLRRAGVPAEGLAAVATVGGGARIPLVTQRLSESLRMPVTTTPDALTVAAIGAALTAGREPESATRAVAAPQTGTLAAAAVAPLVARAPAALAWSQEPEADELDLELTAQDAEWARPKLAYEPHADEALPVPAWYQRPAVLFAAAASAVVLASAGLLLTMHGDPAPAAATAPLTSAAAPAGAAPQAAQNQQAAPVGAAPAPGDAPVTQTVVDQSGPVVQQQPVQQQAADAPAAQAPAPAVDAPAPVVDAPPPVVDAPPPVVDAPPPVIQAPPPVFQMPPVMQLPPIVMAPPRHEKPPQSAPPSSPPQSAPPSSPPASAPPASPPQSAPPQSAPPAASSAPTTSEVPSPPAHGGPEGGGPKGGGAKG